MTLAEKLLNLERKLYGYEIGARVGLWGSDDIGTVMDHAIANWDYPLVMIRFDDGASEWIYPDPRATYRTTSQLRQYTTSASTSASRS